MSLSHFRYRFAIRVKRKYSYKWYLSCWIIRDLFSLLTQSPTNHVLLPLDQPIFPCMAGSDSNILGPECNSEDEIVMSEQNTILSVSSAAELKLKHQQSISHPREDMSHTRTASALSEQSGGSLMSVYSNEENSEVTNIPSISGNVPVPQPVLYPFVMPYSMPVFPMPQTDMNSDRDSGEGTQTGYPLMINQMPVIPVYPQGTDMNANYMSYMNQMGLMYYAPVPMNSVVNEQTRIPDQETKNQSV